MGLKEQVTPRAVPSFSGDPESCTEQYDITDWVKAEITKLYPSESYTILVNHIPNLSLSTCHGRVIIIKGEHIFYCSWVIDGDGFKIYGKDEIDKKLEAKF